MLFSSALSSSPSRAPLAPLCASALNKRLAALDAATAAYVSKTPLDDATAAFVSKTALGDAATNAYVTTSKSTKSVATAAWTSNHTMATGMTPPRAGRRVVFDL
jgi:hypothetical protein